MDNGTKTLNILEIEAITEKREIIEAIREQLGNKEGINYFFVIKTR